MMWLPWETAVDLNRHADRVARRRCGVVEAADGRFVRLVLRPWPKWVSRPAVLLMGAVRRRRAGDRCRLYYHQPWGHPRYLVVSYVVSAAGTSLATFYRTLDVIDHVARLKGSDAILCDAANERLTLRIMARRGWEPHCPSPWHRHFIKRFYGDYPSPPAWLARPSSAMTATPPDECPSCDWDRRLV